MKIIKIDLENLAKKIIKETTETLKRGNVVIVPTDTVYGLIGDATNETAVNKIFQIKQRPLNKPLGVFVRDIQMARKYVRIKKTQEKYLKTADTFILPLKKNLPLQRDALGVRLPRSDLVLILIESLGFPLVQTSANISGHSAPNKIQNIIKIFKAQIIQPDLILNAGDLPKRRPSRVIDLRGKKPRVIRK